MVLPFQGTGSGVGEMTWGQQSIWQTMRRTGRTMNIGGTVPLAPGTTLDEMAAMLRYIVSRHQTLRTRFRYVPHGLPQQVVSESGEIALDIVDVGSDANAETADEADAKAEAAAEQLRSHYEFTPFDHPNEWPVRMGVIRRDGALTHLVVQYCHLVIDGFGINAVVRDLANQDLATGAGTTPVAGLTPLEIAARQRSAAGVRQSERSLRYWADMLRTIPAQRLGTSTDPREPRFWDHIRRSPALYVALRSIAHRTGVGAGHVLLAIYAVALARQTGRSPSVTQVLVSNRFRPGCADSASHLTQPSICAIDVVDTTFDAVVNRAWQAATTAYLYGYFDTLAHNELVRRVTRERGEFDISCFVNDRTSQSGPLPLGTPPDEAELRVALPASTTWWERKLDTFDGTLYVSFDAVVPDAIDVSVCADTHRLGPRDIEALAERLETVAVEAAFDGNVPTRVR
jgi:hypothetical protein